MSSTPVVAQRKQQSAKAKIEKKLSAIESILVSGQLDRLPNSMKPATFADWVDDELGIEKFSRNLLYSKKACYTKVRQDMDSLLGKVEAIRLKEPKKVNEGIELLKRVETAELRAQTFANDYQLVLAELHDRDDEIERLKLQLRRSRESNGKVTVLRAVKPTKKTDK